MATRGGRFIAVAMLMLLSCWLIGGPAGVVSAQTTSEHTVPKDGTTLKDPPTRVSFVFDEDLRAKPRSITATSVDTGESLKLGRAKVSADTITVDWPDDALPGEYRVGYKVVTATGHKRTGHINFTISSAHVTSAGSDPLLPPHSAAPVEPEATDQAQALALTPEKGQMDSNTLIVIAGLGVVALIGTGAGLLSTRRGR